MEILEDRTKLICGAITFLGVGISVVSYAAYLSSRAPSSTFAPVVAAYNRTATTMYLFGVPALIIGVCFAMNAYKQRNSSMSHEKFMAKISPPQPPVAPDDKTVLCPDCGNILRQELRVVKPDGSVTCGNCYKRFIPPN